MNIRVLIFLLCGVIAGCVTPISVSRLDEPREGNAFLYRAFPREVIVSYNDREAYAKANARKKEKHLSNWDAEIFAQYAKDLAQIRAEIFTADMPSSVEIIRESNVVPTVFVRVLNRDAYEWLYAHPKTTHLSPNEAIEMKFAPIKSPAKPDVQ